MNAGDDEEPPPKGRGRTWVDLGPDVARVPAREMAVLGRNGAPLPLSPPGRGGGFKEAPRPTEAGFRAAREREAERGRKLEPDELRYLDLAKLRELVDRDDSELGEWGATAFPSMLERLENGSAYLLSDRQREAVDEALERLSIRVDPPPKIGGFR